MLGDLAAKVEELEGAVRENESTRNALKAAFSRLASAQVGWHFIYLFPEWRSVSLTWHARDHANGRAVYMRSSLC